MATRRLKRISSANSAISASEETDVPACKRQPKTRLKVEKSNSKDSTDVKQSERTRRSNRVVKSTKSSYFESPVASEDSSSADENFKSSRNNRKSNIPVKDVKSKFFESSDESEEYDSEDEFVDSSRKRKRNIRSSVVKKKNKSKCENDDNSEFVDTKLVTNIVGNSSSNAVKGFESESESSSDEEPKLNRTTANNQSSSLLADPLNPLESDDETTTPNEPTEFFDFTALVSQMSQATSEKDEKESTKEAIIEKEKPVPETSTRTKSRNKKITTASNEPSEKNEKMEVFELLAMGEKTDMSAKDIKESVAKAEEEYEVPQQVEIVLDTPLVKKKKRCDDLEMALRRRLNNVRRENQVYVHKVHALCWIAHGIYLNRLLNSAELLGSALSLVPNEQCYPPKRMNVEYLEKLITWFGNKVKLAKDPGNDERIDLIVSLQNQFEKKEADTRLDLCFMFICVIRALGIKCRLIINLNVAPIKPTSEQLLPITQKKEDETSVQASTLAKKQTNKTEKKTERASTSIKIEPSSSGKKSVKSAKVENSVDKEKDKGGKKTECVKKEKSSATKAKETRKSYRSEYFASKESDKDGRSDSGKSTNKKPTERTVKTESGINETNIRRSSRLTNSTSKYFHEAESDDEESKQKPSRRQAEKKKVSKTQKDDPKDLSVEVMSTSDSDGSADEFRTPKKKINRKVISTDEEAGTPNEKADPNKKLVKKMNYWLEVFLEAEERWVSVDIVKKKYLCDDELSRNASAPIRYILALNNDQTVKDITRRYAHQFLSVTRKLRADDDWWKSTMAPFKPPSTPQEREEDEELERKLEEQPLPKTISEYKNHPLYALQRHLLKFQAIYPEDAIPVGYIGKEKEKEPVYRRACVHQLHGREMWIKEAKVVKMNEKPYKIVKGRQNRHKLGQGEGPRDLELFGIWQVEDYVPPTAENGKVPRNAFGNVELFKMSMLPKGTVYLQVPGLQRIANKLNIDCAAAITGFEYSTNGWSYPVKDGFVVCEEFKDILLDAFNQEVEEAEKKEKQKREDRIYSNWKRLIRAMHIAERLKRKYNFGEPFTTKKSSETSVDKKSGIKTKK